MSLVLLAPLQGTAAEGPLCILHLGQDGTSSARHVHALMREFGRDALWFETTTTPAPDWARRFDAVLVDTPNPDSSALANVPANRRVSIDFPANDADLLKPEFLASVKTRLLDAVGESRRKEWQAFLAGREPERREPSPTVANYENRPQPVTFQHPFSVRGSIERTQVAPDLKLVPFAAEPDIAKPIAMAWDERGRCWVAETRDYPHDVKPTGEGNDSIKVCEDTDGDGRADKFTVFADKLNIPTSFVFARGGIIVAQPPRLLFLRDTDGDDRADVREVVMEGWGIADTHAQANNLHWGHDNWLYGCVGYSGFKGYVGGHELEFRMGTFRFKADGSALEFLHQFSNNSWGHGVNDAGDQFGGTANGAPIFYGGIPATAFPQGARGITAKKINVEDLAHPITPNFRQVDVFGGYTAAAGSAFISSGNLPPRLQGKAMVCEPTMKLIALMDVQPQGAGYLAKDGFNLVASSDEWMSPVFAEVGPDGAVWFADWQNFIIQHNPTPSVARGGYDAKTGVGGAHENPLRDHVRGRIYRVVWDQAKVPAIRSLRSASDAQLVQALGNDTLHWRYTAQRLIVEGKKTGTAPELRRLVTATNLPPSSTTSAIHALWTLHGLGQLDDATHHAALLSQRAELRRNAVRALGDDAHSQTLFFGAGVISDPDLVTRLAAFVKLSEFPTAPQIQTVVANLSRNPASRSDEWLAEATRLLARKHQVALYREGDNLLPNSSLEELADNGMPKGWTRRDYGNRPANQSARWSSVSGTGVAHTGDRAILCEAADGEADTSLYADVTLEPNTSYRLSGWVHGRGLRGKLSFNDHINRYETERVTRDGEWTEVEAVFNSGAATRGSINILFVARGQGWFDDVRLSKLLPAETTEVAVAAGDPKRGETIFFKHAAACVYCHQIRGQGSTVGPALDGIASRQPAEYIKESLLTPSKVLAKGYEGLSMSPMPPMGDIFTPQELADIQAFVATLR
ncbi:MAG: c-type cytochrome [Verrucomicrobiales bacterium]|nr:c-type cytochrome [Verrucomicrobiales bacterium]